MTATDRDEPGTLHTKLKYRIVGQDPLPIKGPGVFNIHPDTGSITVVSPTLDREVTLPESSLGSVLCSAGRQNQRQGQM